MNRSLLSDKNAMVLWFCGLSGSGKSTIAGNLKKKLLEREYAVLVLDGDDIRKRLHHNLGFTPNDIKLNNHLIAQYCCENKNKFDFILVPIISPFTESRENARRMIGSRFIEVYIKCSLTVCKKRDPKGLYKKAENGEIANFIGIARENPFQPPENPDIEIDAEISSPQKAIEQIESHLIKCQSLAEKN